MMAKEFKHSDNKDFKGKKKYSPKKYTDDHSDKRALTGAYSDSPSRTNQKSDERSSDFKKRSPDKNANKPSFNRFRDDSRPSDFGSPKSRVASNYSDSPKKSGSAKSFFKKRRDDGDEKPSFRDREESPRSFNKKPFSDKPDFKKRRDDGDEKPSFRDREESPKSFSKKPFSDKPDFKKRRDDTGERPSFRGRSEDKPKPFNKKPFSEKPPFVKKSNTVNPNDLDESDFEYGNKKPAYTSNSGRAFKKAKPKSFEKNHTSSPHKETDDGLIRLNKYLSNAGICSRREADDLISSGVVQVNGKTITEMGYKVKPTDIVKYGGQTLKKERLVYLLLNKPKDYITTADDPQERRTVLELVQNACRERIYPVGRLDRATTGLLMFTNDGDLTKKLTHPHYGVRKVYHVELDKPLKRGDLDKIAEGIELEDGPVKVDEITYVGNGIDKAQVGIEIHSGKNRIVRRIFEHLGYNVRKLDRVMFGSLTKKDLPRGRWRMLTEAEVGMLKMISAK